MKKILTLALILISLSISAQTKITVTEKMVAIDGTSRNSLTVIIEGAQTDAVKKAWKKYLKSLKGKVSDKTVIFADDCKLKTMGDNTFDIYSLVEEATDEGVRLVVAFDLGGAYLSTKNHADQYPAGEKVVYDFAVAQAKEAVNIEIGVITKTLGTLEKDLSGFEKEKDGLEKDIEGYEKKIEEAKEKIEKNLANQANKKTQIEEAKATQQVLTVQMKAIK